ncbi:hypothetical protein An12g08150 [Aspergillus niger]|uniref:Uncharacterized protein n=2 Tax=Aspergillus niger TaxID=5061 RepID=A2R0C7_ASPNC|nr:hypothetical protein An12g08150 [Aspergillus niger]CAK41265.1 hypothetical protein An12g08150 [Aspergillus niger]
MTRSIRPLPLTGRQITHLQAPQILEFEFICRMHPQGVADTGFQPLSLTARYSGAGTCRIDAGYNASDLMDEACAHIPYRLTPQILTFLVVQAAGSVWPEKIAMAVAVRSEVLGWGAGLVAYARLCSWTDRAIVSEQYTKRDNNQSGARYLKLGSAGSMNWGVISASVATRNTLSRLGQRPERR